MLLAQQVQIDSTAQELADAPKENERIKAKGEIGRRRTPPPIQREKMEANWFCVDMNFFYKKKLALKAVKLRGIYSLEKKKSTYVYDSLQKISC